MLADEHAVAEIAQAIASGVGEPERSRVRAESIVRH
jgi:hypothetical protein